MARKATEPIERFMKYVQIDEVTGCWNWIGARGGYKNHYGVFSTGTRQGKQVYAHRWSYEHFVGPIPDGKVQDHLCRNTLCVNYEHVEPVEQRENVLRGESIAAKRAKQQYCKYGHPFNEANTYITQEGYRKCKICSLERDRIRRPARGNRMSDYQIPIKSVTQRTLRRRAKKLL